MRRGSSPRHISLLMQRTLAGFGAHGKMHGVKPSVPALHESYDLLVIGGGVNGTGIARDAAGRGYSVLLCEQHDLAAHTSSASTKLIHGGLRYLEGFHFALVRKALQEREVLLAAAPHIMRPLRFVMPHDAHLRPMWMIRAGLFLYDNLARRRRLAASAPLDLRTHPAGTPLQSRFQRGFIYSDGWADDARLVALNARDAADRGAHVLTRTACEKVVAQDGSWRALLNDGQAKREISARAVVNATGPWVSRFLREASPVQAERSVRLVKGSHIVVPQLFAHRFAYIFQNVDRRIVFAIPYEDAFTLVGTTDVDFHGEPGEARIDMEEIRYLCATVNRYFTRQIEPGEVAWSYSGVRPLLDDHTGDASKVTRDYSLELDAHPAPLLSVFGGKLTTYRKLSQTAVDKLEAPLGKRKAAWTAGAFLPGGDFTRIGLRGGAQAAGFAAFLRTVERRYPWLPPALRTRLASAYGTRIERVIGDARALEQMGEEVVPGLFAREIDYLCAEEWARTAEDILWRRSKLGLHLPRDAAARLDSWLAARS
jgi:glycerol-3-phosphate dehydrogenase